MSRGASRFACGIILSKAPRSGLWAELGLYARGTSLRIDGCLFPSSIEKQKSPQGVLFTLLGGFFGFMGYLGGVGFPSFKISYVRTNDLHKGVFGVVRHRINFFKLPH